MHVDSNGTEQDWASELWPDDSPDPDWPDDWPEGDRPDAGDRPYRNGVPPVGVGSGTRGRSSLALGLTFAIALGAGAGAVYLYKSALAGPAPGATSPSPRATNGGGPVTGGGPAALPGPAGAGSVESMTMLGKVLAVTHDSVTVGGGPGLTISARATSATRFAGSVRSLAQVRVGDTVTAQISVTDGVATLVRLQDPASQP
jgi:hypothetical protein